MHCSGGFLWYQAPTKQPQINKTVTPCAASKATETIILYCWNSPSLTTVQLTPQ